jgi:hypothetical protein
LIKRIILCAITALGLLTAGTSAAFASGTPNQANASLIVTSVVGTSGFPTTVNFGTNAAGTTASATETPYSITSNTSWSLSLYPDVNTTDGSGSVFSLSQNDGKTIFWTPTSAVPNPLALGGLQVTHNGASQTLGNTVNTGDTQGTSDAVVLGTGSATPVGGVSYTDSMSEAIPSNTSPATYRGTFVYVLTSS